MKFYLGILGLLYCFSAIASPVNELRLHIIRAPLDMNWKSINGLAISWLRNEIMTQLHPIGHFFVEVQCDSANKYGVDHILTGMTFRPGAQRSDFLGPKGSGLPLYRKLPGRMQSSEKAKKSIRKAKKRDRYQSVVVSVSTESCQEMLEFAEKWIDHGSYQAFGFGDTSHGEAAGCAPFAEEFYKMATGQEFPESWMVYRQVPRQLVGTEDHSVSALRVVLRRPWAKADEESLEMRVGDPTYAYDHFQDAVTSGPALENNIYRLQKFTFTYPQTESSQSSWARIKY